ncbi:MAG: hypothetical protein J5594_06265 [Elusimicrobiaceae bacterium]|nr:hypothetical protein [Elusimicrobiaceae bacterium]
MKFLNLIILALCFCACTAGQNIKKINETQGRVIPAFMTGKEQRTALKTTLEVKEKAHSFLLLANKKEDYINFKLIGDFAAVLVSINLRGNDFEYESSSPLLSNPNVQRALEEILLALFAPEKCKNLKHKYYFKKGENLPYELKQKGEMNKTFLFEDYDGNIPQKITIKTKFNVVKINFELLAHN